MNLLVGGKVGSEATPVYPLPTIDPVKDFVNRAAVKLFLKKKKKMTSRTTAPKPYYNRPQVSKMLKVVQVAMSQSKASPVQASIYPLNPNLINKRRGQFIYMKS